MTSDGPARSQDCNFSFKEKISDSMINNTSAGDLSASELVDGTMPYQSTNMAWIDDFKNMAASTSGDKMPVGVSEMSGYLSKPSNWNVCPLVDSFTSAMTSETPSFAGRLVKRGNWTVASVPTPTSLEKLISPPRSWMI
jgi:hypothetical protein